MPTGPVPAVANQLNNSQASIGEDNEIPKNALNGCVYLAEGKRLSYCGRWLSVKGCLFDRGKRRDSMRPTRITCICTIFRLSYTSGSSKDTCVNTDSIRELTIGPFLARKLWAVSQGSKVETDYSARTLSLPGSFNCGLKAVTRRVLLYERYNGTVALPTPSHSRVLQLVLWR